MQTSTIERRLAAIIAMDVVAYSRLMGVDEVGTLTALKTHRAELIDPSVSAHRGRLVKTTGDGLLLEFASIVDAIGCAVAVQRGMLARNADVPEDKRIVFRIGVNIGDIIIDGGDIYGDGVNVAARLEALCEPGGVCISRSANEQIRDKLSLSFSDLGDHTVKNIARAVGVFGLAAKDIASLPEIPVYRPQPTRLPPTHRWRWSAAVAASVCAIVLAGLAAWWFNQPRSAALPRDRDLPALPPVASLPAPVAPPASATSPPTSVTSPPAPSTSPPQAPSASPPPAARAELVKDVFEKYHLLGTFSANCARAVSDRNPLILHWVLDDGRVQRDSMIGPTTASDFSIIDSATAREPNEVAISLANQRRRLNIVLRLEPGRWRVWELARENGEKLVAGGQVTDGTRDELPWLNKCST